MAALIYAMNASLDGYIEDADGDFGWSEPGEEVHRFWNDLVRSAGAFLYGRRMYETMAGWETDPSFAAQSDYARDFAEIWQATDKIVFSTTLAQVSTARTTMVRDFDPEEVRRLKESAGRDLMIAGPGLAAHAFRSGLIDECHLVVSPIAVGGGKRALPEGLRLDLTLLDERRFGEGKVHLRYGVRLER